MRGIRAGAITAPMLDPELNSVVARARSRWGNHWAVALTAAGKFPPSLRPRATRAAKNPPIDPTNAWPMAARLQPAIDAA